jgi:hypothetical protein
MQQSNIDPSTKTPQSPLNKKFGQPFKTALNVIILEKKLFVEK